MHVLLTVLHNYVSYGPSWENLPTHQDISSLVIISLILTTCMVDKVMVL